MNKYLVLLRHIQVTHPTIPRSMEEVLRQCSGELKCSMSEVYADDPGHFP